MEFMEPGNLRDERGRLLPGHEGLKRKGSNNKLQSEIKQKIADFLNGKLDTVEEIYNEVSPKDKLHFLGELLAYILPKSKIFLEETISKDDADLSLWADEDLRTLGNLYSKYNPSAPHETD